MQVAQIDGKSVQRSYTPVSNNSDKGVLELVVSSPSLRSLSAYSV